MSTSTTSGFLHDLSIEQISHILQCAQDIGSDSSEVFTILRGQKRSIDERIANRRSRLVELEDETGQIQDEIRSLGKQLVQCKSAISNANRLASATPTRTCKRAIDEVEDSNLDEALLDRKTRRRRVQPGSNDPGTALVPNVGFPLCIASVRLFSFARLGSSKLLLRMHKYS